MVKQKVDLIRKNGLKELGVISNNKQKNYCKKML